MGFRKKTGGGREDRWERNQLLQCPRLEPIKDTATAGGVGSRDGERLGPVEYVREVNWGEDLKGTPELAITKWLVMLVKVVWEKQRGRRKIVLI